MEEEIRATFYSIGDGVISTDAAGRVTRMNPVAEQLTGWSEAEVLGKPVEQVFHIVNEETRAEVENPVARVMHDGMVVNLANHTLLIARDGTDAPSPTAARRSATNKARSPAWCWSSATRRTSGGRREAQDTRALWDSALSSITDVFYVFDVSGNFLVWNELSPELPVTAIKNCLPSSRQISFQAKISNEYPRLLREYGKMVLRNKMPCLSSRMGPNFPTSSPAQYCRDGAGDTIGFSGTGRDLTERKRAEERSKLDEARANTLLELSQMTDRSAAEIANHAMESAIRLTGSTIGYIAFANEDETVLTMHYWSNSAMQQCAMIDKPIVYPVKDTGLWGEAIRQRKAGHYQRLCRSQSAQEGHSVGTRPAHAPHEHPGV